MAWRSWHYYFGLAGLLVFILTGQYMARVLDMPAMPDAQRLLYRSAHIYLLLLSVANVCAGYFMARDAETSGLLQGLCSGLLLVSVPMMTLSFFVESTPDGIERPINLWTLYGVFLAGTLLALQELWRRFKG